MRVERITPVTKKRSSVCVEGQPAIVLYNGELSRYRIREEEEISEDVWEEILQILIRRSRKRALNLLIKSDRTRNGLLEKLKSDGYPDRIAEQAVVYCESYGYINDDRYVQRYLDGPGAKKSRRASRMDLLRKGVDAGTVDRVMEEYEQDTEQNEKEKAAGLLRKRLGEAHRLEEKEYRRIYAYLARRGFSASDILSVLQEYQREAEF